jgi:peptidoglycan/LPS O-acetylase OafA/YrhL
MPSLTLQVPAVVQRRIPEIDELKGLAILLVVLYHAGGTLGWYNRLHGDLGVDMFVILSGLGLALGGAYTNARDFLQRRLVRILPAYWIVLTAYWALNSHILQRQYSTAEIVLHYLGIHALCGDFYAMGINDSFWFVTLILGLYVIYCVLHSWLRDPGKLLLAGSILCVTLALVYFYQGQASVFSHLTLRLPGFFLGILTGQLLKAGRLDVTLSVQLGLALFVFSYVPYIQGVIFTTVPLGAGLMAAYVFGLRPALPASISHRVGGFLEFLGKYSLEIFLIHQPLIREYAYYSLGRFLNIPAPTVTQLILAMLAGLAVTVVLSVELQRLLARLPWGRQSSKAT